MTDSRLQTALTVLPVLGAGLFLLGTAYYQGYLAAFGIEDSLFPLSLERTLLWGYVAFISFGLEPTFYAATAIVFLMFTVLVAAFLSSASRVKRLQEKLASLRRRFSPKFQPSETMVKVVDQGAAFYSYALGVILMLLLLITGAALSAKSGRERGEKEIHSFQSKNGNYVVLRSPLFDSPKQAKQIICGPSHCAFWMENEGVILRHENVDIVSTHIAKNKTAIASPQK